MWRPICTSNQIVHDEATAADIGAKMSSIIPQWRHRDSDLSPQAGRGDWARGQFFTAAIADKGFFQCTLPANSFAGFREGLVAELGLADPPRASHPQTEVVEVEIDDGCRVER